MANELLVVASIGMHQHISNVILVATDNFDKPLLGLHDKKLAESYI